MEKKKIGFFRAIFRYFRYRDWKKARGIILAEEEQFTASVDGISAAFDIQYKKMVAQANELKEALEEVESILAAKRSRFKELDKEKEDLLREREDTIIKSEEATAANDHQAYETHSHTFDRIQLRLDEIEQIRPRLHQEIIETSQNLDKYKLKLQEFQAQIDMLPKQKEEAIANFISAKQACQGQTG